MHKEFKSGTGFGIRDLESQMKKKTIRFCYEEIRDPWVNITGSKDGAVMWVLASHRCGLGSIPGVGVTCGLSFLKVLALAPSLRGFSSRSSGFRPSTKTSFQIRTGNGGQEEHVHL